MIQRFVYVKLKEPRLRESIAQEARKALHAVPVVLNAKVGLPADEGAEVWDMVFVLTFEAYEHVAVYVDDPIHVAFVREHLAPNVEVKKVWNFEMK